MLIELHRRIFTEHSTIGDLLIDGEFLCFTLEDPVRDIKIPGETAIPYGRYKVIITHSNRFKRLLPLLLNVPNFEGIRIHPGNTAADTEGCILVADTKGPDFVGCSRSAFNRLFPILQNSPDEIWIEITRKEV
jgi:hypothetical protein